MGEARPVARVMGPSRTGAQRFGMSGQLLGRACLADAWFPGQDHQPTAADDGIIQGGPEPGHAPLMTNEYYAGLP